MPYTVTMERDAVRVALTPPGWVRPVAVIDAAVAGALATGLAILAVANRGLSVIGWGWFLVLCVLCLVSVRTARSRQDVVLDGSKLTVGKGNRSGSVSVSGGRFIVRPRPRFWSARTGSAVVALEGTSVAFGQLARLSDEQAQELASRLNGVLEHDACC